MQLHFNSLSKGGEEMATRKKKTVTNRKDTGGIAGKVATGAATIALAAGTVAAGAALADKRTRNKLTKGARNAMQRVGGMVSEGQERVQAVQHQVTGRKKRK